MPDRLAVDECEEHVVAAVDTRELIEVALGEHRLGAAEPHQARLRSEPVEHRLHGARLTVPQWADGDAVDDASDHELLRR